MLDFLDKYEEYGGKWTVSAEELLSEVSPKLFKRVESAVIVMSPGCHNDQYDFDGSLQMQLNLEGGTCKYLPLSTESLLEEGDEVDVDSIMCIELTRPGDDPCYKVDGDKIEVKPKKKGK